MREKTERKYENNEEGKKYIKKIRGWKEKGKRIQWNEKKYIEYIWSKERIE